MEDFIVGCELTEYEGKVLVLPRCSAVRERIIRCGECGHCNEMPNGQLVCMLRSEHFFRTKPERFCSEAVLR